MMSAIAVIMQAKPSTLRFFSVQSVGACEQTFAGSQLAYVTAVKTALFAAANRVNVPVDVVSGAGVILDSYRGEYQADGTVRIVTCRGRLGLAATVEAGLASIVGVAS